MSLLRGCVALLMSAVLSCACDEAAPPGNAAPTARSSAIAAHGLCEHGVEAELCPKHNPDLATIYQSHGNWCAEHGMPESFCPICHPEAKGRPPEGASPAKEPSGPKAPADGLKVTLRGADIVAKTGIETVAAVKAPPRTAVRFPARAVYDATKTAEVSASAGGVVRSVAFDVGARVEKGAILATLDSATIGEGRAKLIAAQARVKAAEENLERVGKLEKEGIVARRDVLEAQTTLDAARAEVSGVASELGVSGASAGSGASYPVKSPLAGVITRRDATIGRAVEAQHVLFQVVDASTLWVELDVPETMTGAIDTGDEVALTFAALPDAPFAGKVAAILPEVRPETRTVTVRAAVDNAALRLRANMFGEAALLRDTPALGVSVPRASIQSFGKTKIVFVRVSPNVFVVRHVELATRDGDLALVTSGLAAGEEVATTGSFLLRTETLKDTIGAGCCAAD